MEPVRTDAGVRVGGDARQRFHDARGYGELVDGEVLLDPVEAAYLLYREDLSAVEGMGFSGYVRAVDEPRLTIRFFVYKDLRERGFYLAPTQGDHDFVVYERGSDPRDGEVAFTVRVLDERIPIAPASLDPPGVLAIVDEEGEVGYVSLEAYRPDGTISMSLAGPIDADLVGNRVIAWDPPAALYTDAFFGQPLAGRNTRAGPLQLSLVEADYLDTEVGLTVSSEAIRECGRSIEGRDRFDARARVYRRLREAGVVPKTGLKFGADFRVYHSFDGVDEMGHSAVLVRVLDPEEPIDPAAIALDVRLAHGVGKRMVFALPDDTDTTTISWVSVTRITP